MLIRKRTLLASAASALLIPRAARATNVSYALNLAGVTPPALPVELTPVIGAWSTVTDGSSVNYLNPTATNPNDISFPETQANPATIVTTFQANAGSPPATSRYTICLGVRPGGGSYQMQFAHDSSASGAVWIQKNADGGGSQTILSSFVGTTGTTITNGVKYTATFTASGTSTVTLTGRVQRLTDNNYLTSSGTWSATPQDCVSGSDSSSPYLVTGATQLEIYRSSADFVCYSWILTDAVPQFTQYNGGAAPVLVKGGTYDGVTATWLQGVRWCYDGTRYVMSVQVGNGSDDYQGFFTASTLRGPWTFVTGSLLSPASGYVVIGNGGIVWWNNAYWMAQWNWNGGSPASTVEIWTGTDLLAANWTKVVSPLINSGEPFSPVLRVNPDSGLLELFYALAGSGRAVFIRTSADGVTWGGASQIMAVPSGLSNFGQLGVWYSGSVRYLTSDATPAALNYRSTAMYHSPGQNTSWIFDGYVNGPRPSIPWQSVQTFDADVNNADLGDGNGSIPWALYAGGDNNGTTLDTSSSIGLAGFIQTSTGSTPNVSTGGLIGWRGAR